MLQEGHIYFHSPCFDGIVSAVLISDYFESCDLWSCSRLHSVNYHLKNSWLETDLEKPAAVVDFLYHSKADFWADHHPTTFLSDHALTEYKKNKSPSFIYDSSAPSCAMLLWNHLKESFNYRNKQLRELVKWSERTDAARYDSVKQAIFGKEPALRINSGLVLSDKSNYCERLVRNLRHLTLEEVANLDEVQNKYELTQNLTKLGLKRIEKSIKLDDDGIATFDVTQGETLVHRYAPFHFFPDARYSAGIVRSKNRTRITAMRNPWLEFESVLLGNIFAQVGGGGHQRVGTVVLNEERVNETGNLFKNMVVYKKRMLFCIFSCTNSVRQFIFSAWLLKLLIVGTVEVKISLNLARRPTINSATAAMIVVNKAAKTPQ